MFMLTKNQIRAAVFIFATFFISLSTGEMNDGEAYITARGPASVD